MPRLSNTASVSSVMTLSSAITPHLPRGPSWTPDASSAARTAAPSVSSDSVSGIENGEPGIAVAHEHARHRHALVFDARSYRLLGDTDRLVARSDYVDAAPGNLIGGRAYVDSGIVASQFARP